MTFFGSKNQRRSLQRIAATCSLSASRVIPAAC